MDNPSQNNNSTYSKMSFIHAPSPILSRYKKEKGEYLTDHTKKLEIKNTKNEVNLP